MKSDQRDYWKIRCLLAEKCLDESPCDPDITVSQTIAHQEYNKFIDFGHVSDEEKKRLLKIKP